MACSITITSVAGVGPANPPSDIRITGTAVDCRPNPATGKIQVQVRSTCHGGPTLIDVDAAGNWVMVEKNAEGCKCDARIFVRVECASDPSCFKELTTILTCDRTTVPPTTTTQPPACHVITISNSTPPCSTGGAVQMTFTATITPAAPPFAGVVDWEVTDSASTVVDSAYGGGLSETFTFPGPGVYQVTATIVRPGCTPLAKTASKQIVIPSCNCPTFIGSIIAVVDGNNPCSWTFSAPVNNPNNVPINYAWDFDVGGTPSATANTTVPNAANTYVNSGTKTVRVTLTAGACTDVVEIQIDVFCGTTTTTTPTPPTTTQGPGPSTTTQGPTPTPTTQGPTQTPSGGGGFGCICTLLLVLAIIATGTAAIALMAWGCAGFNPIALTVAIASTIAAVILFIIWALLCRACAQIRLLARMFMLLAIIMAIGALIFALTGQIGCAIGALAVAALFVMLSAILSGLASRLRCP